jgi:outer membrane protein TolC
MKILIVMLASVFVVSTLWSNSLDSLLDIALKVSPKIKMLQSKQVATEARIPQVSNLSDPVLSIGTMSLPLSKFSFREDPMTAKAIGVTQMFPFPGRLEARAAVEQKDVEIVQQEIAFAKLEIIREVSKNYYDLWFIREALKLAKKNIEILRNISEIVQTKFTVGMASLSDAIQVESDITMLNERIIELEAKEKSLVSVLNAYLLRPVNSIITTDSLRDIPNIELDSEVWLSLAKENNPYLRQIILSEQKSKSYENFANFEFYPNFGLSLQYLQRDALGGSVGSGMDMVSLMFDIELPIDYGGKKSSMVEEAKVMQKMYSEEYQMALQMLNIEFVKALAELQEMQKRAKLIYEVLLPQIVKNLEVDIENFQVGKVDILNVLNTQRKYYEIETSLYSLRANFWSTIAEVEFQSGIKIIN